MNYLITNTSATVHAWARVGDGTSIEWIASDDEVEFTLGGSSGFELLASTEGLRRLVREGAKALTKLDAETQIPGQPIHEVTMTELVTNQYDQEPGPTSFGAAVEHPSPSPR